MTMFGARSIWGRLRRSGGLLPASSRLMDRPFMCWGRILVTCLSGSSPRLDMRATQCGCSLKKASHQHMLSRRFIAGCREDFGANAVLHFGTHGALEFMPGKQAGMSGACWPDRLISDLPNFYLYASNNPSEGTMAKRRAAATLVSYLTPPCRTCRALSRARRFESLDRSLAQLGT